MYVSRKIDNFFLYLNKRLRRMILVDFYNIVIEIALITFDIGAIGAWRANYGVCAVPIK